MVENYELYHCERKEANFWIDAVDFKFSQHFAFKRPSHQSKKLLCCARNDRYL